VTDVTGQPDTAPSSNHPVTMSRFTRRVVGIGPGIVFALSVIGPGSFIANATAGATYGYALIWVLAVTVVFRFAWLDASARYVLATGETLMAGYARVGTWLVWLLLAVIVLARHVLNLYKLALLGLSIHFLLPLPTEHSVLIWSLFFVFAGFALMFWGGYPAIESLCKILIALMGTGLALAAILTHPPVGSVLAGAFLPVIPESVGVYSTVLVIAALIGTEAGSLTNLTYSYFLFEKGWRDPSLLRRQRLDLTISVITIFVMGSFIQIAAAGTIHASGQFLESASDLVRIFTDHLGKPGRVIFALGLWGAVFTGYVGPTTGYAIMVRDICRRFVPAFRQLSNGASDDVKKDPIFRWAIAFWAFSPIYVLFIDWKPVRITLTVNAAIAVLVPLLTAALLWITNSRSTMGKLRNGWFTNTVLATVALLSVYVLAQNAIGWWAELGR